VICLQVEIQTTKGRIHNIVQSDSAHPVLADALYNMSKLDWAYHLFDSEASPSKLLPGHIVILDNRMVQPWDFGELPIEDGQKLKIVQVVPGG
jgi:sulfur carrier protein ThiS